jgi:hypothetical protein
MTQEERDQQRKEFIKELAELLKKYDVTIEADDQYGGDEVFLGRTYSFQGFGWSVDMDEKID